MRTLSWMLVGSAFVLLGGCRRDVAQRASEDAGAVAAPPPSTIALDVSKRASSGEIPITLTITLTKGALALDGKPVTEDQLRAQLLAAHDKNPEARAILQIEGSTPHRDVIHLIDVVKQGGISQIALGVLPASTP